MSADVADTDVEQAREYLNSLVGENSAAAMRDAFLAQGPAMLKYLRDNTAIRFNHCPNHADYHPELPGARAGGRPVEPAVFDGRLLGESFRCVRGPISEFMVFGGMMVSKADIDLLLAAQTNPSGALHALQLGLRFLRDKSKFSRGTRLTMGNALCASLLHECLARDVTILLDAQTKSIEPTGHAFNHAHRLQLNFAGTTHSVTANQGVIFAGGGFSGNASARAEHLPAPTPSHTAAFEGADGSSQQLALTLGAQFGPSCEHNAWWFPSSVVNREDGSVGVFPHIIMDRAKPGLIAVNKAGERFTNEGASYHQFARAQYASSAIPCWLICDAEFLENYGLGAVRPGRFGLRRAVESGYVMQADSLSALAEKAGIDARGLINSANRMNTFATTGEDTDFGKGSDSLSKQNGDALYAGQNPCLGPVQKAPFYAVQVSPADLGTSRGLLTDQSARLVDKNSRPIAGLYACGNDMQSVMGGSYPAPGVTLGPGMTFAYVAALDCIERAE